MHRRQVSTTSRALSLFVAACVLAACWRPRLESPLPASARPFDPPTVFGEWWAMTAECSGSSAPMASVQFYVVPGVSLFWREGSVVNGFWSRTGNRIVLAEGAVSDGEVVRHEMLHALTNDGRHTRQAFLERCAGVVACLTPCVEAAGGASSSPGAIDVPTRRDTIELPEAPGSKGAEFRTSPNSMRR
jgi:hypothetical protein